MKDAGNMVGDREVVGLLLRQLLRKEYQDGVILDGFPRTNVQVECLKLLKTADQEGKLSLERGSRLPLVKMREERVVFGLHHALGIQTLG